MADMKNMARQAPTPNGKSTPSGDSMSVTPDSVRANMQVPQGMQPAYERIILAAKKIMYSETMKDQIKILLKSKMTMGQKLGRGVIALFALLKSQTNNNLPMQLMIPCATEMVAEAADFLRKAGVKVTDKDVAEGMYVMVSETLQRAKIPMSRVPELLKQQAQAQTAQPQQSTALPRGV